MLLPDLAYPGVKSDCSISNLSLNVRCDNIHLCQCTVFLKSVRSFVSYVSTSFSECRRGPDGSGGKYVPLASIHKCVDVLVVRLILHT